jgi:hypothetical protein
VAAGLSRSWTLAAQSWRSPDDRREDRSMRVGRTLLWVFAASIAAAACGVEGDDRLSSEPTGDEAPFVEVTEEEPPAEEPQESADPWLAGVVGKDPGPVGRPDLGARPPEILEGDGAAGWQGPDLFFLNAATASLWAVDEAEGALLPALAIDDGPDHGFRSVVWDRRDTLYALGGQDQLWAVDVETGAVKGVGTLPVGGVCGLAWGDEALYGVSVAQDALVEIEPSTARATVVMALDLGLADCTTTWDPTSQRVVVIGPASAGMYAVDPVRGTVDMVAQALLPTADVLAAAYAPQDPRLVLSTGGDLWVVRPSTTMPLHLATLETDVRVDNLLFAPGLLDR